MRAQRALVQREVQALDPDVPVADVKTLTEVIQGSAGSVMFQVGTMQAGAMGVLGLLLELLPQLGHGVLHHLAGDDLPVVGE